MEGYYFLTEKELLRRVSEGDENAFRDLYKKFSGKLSRHIFALTRCREMTEEVVQDVFLKIWTNRSTLNGVDNFEGYLFVVSKNHALNCLKKEVRNRIHQAEWEHSEIYKINLSEDAKDECYHILDEAINILPPQQKIVYLLSRHHHLKYNEIAERLNLSRETVKKYIQRATLAITAYTQTNRANILIYLFIFFHFLYSR